MTLDKAKKLCIEAHRGQYRKTIELSTKEVGKLLKVDHVLNKSKKKFDDGSLLYWDDLSEVYLFKEAYHTHPFAVADMMTTDSEKLVALFHDAAEDTDATITLDPKPAITIKNQTYELPHEVIVSLWLLDKTGTSSYKQYIEIITHDKMATKVKIADMFHNMSGSPSVRKKVLYIQALQTLLHSL